jgi:hypothetical protein
MPSTLRYQVMTQQHPKGATYTYTEQYGDMRTHGTGGAAKRRARNTRLEAKMMNLMVWRGNPGKLKLKATTPA